MPAPDEPASQQGSQPDYHPPDLASQPADQAPCRTPPRYRPQTVPPLWQSTPPRSRTTTTTPGVPCSSPLRLGFSPGMSAWAGSPLRFGPGDPLPTTSLLSGLGGFSLFGSPANGLPYLPSPQGTLAGNPFDGLSLINTTNKPTHTLTATAESAPPVAPAAPATTEQVPAAAEQIHELPAEHIPAAVLPIPHLTPAIPTWGLGAAGGAVAVAGGAVAGGGGDLEAIKQAFVEHYKYKHNSPYPSILSDEARTLLYDPPRHDVLTQDRPLKVYAYGLKAHEWQLFGTMHAALSQLTDIDRVVNGATHAERMHVVGAAEAPGKLDALRRAMENQIILVPLSLPYDACDETYFQENLKGHLVLLSIDNNGYIPHSRPLALGIFVGDAVYRNSLDPALRFTGRQDDIAIGVDANPLLAAVHVLTFLHMPTDPKKVPNTLAPTLEELIALSGMPYAPLDIIATADSTSLPPPLRLLVADMRSGSTREELAMIGGMLAALRRTLVNTAAFTYETRERADFVARLVEHVELGFSCIFGLSSATRAEESSNLVALPVAHRTALVAKLAPGRKARWPQDTAKLLRKVNERAAAYVVKLYDTVLLSWHLETDGDMPRVRKRRSGASRPAAKRRGRGRRRQQDETESEESDLDE